MTDGRHDPNERGLRTGDPTENVIALNEAANRRQDDLRGETNRRIETELACVKEVAQLRAEHAKEMTNAESRRLDAVRAVDVLAVNTAAERAQQAIQALAVTTSTMAETLRNALTATAATIATQTAATISAITERIAALEKSSYEGKGKSGVTDPMLEQLLTKMDNLGRSQTASRGQQDLLKFLTPVALTIVGLAIAVAVYFK